MRYFANPSTPPARAAMSAGQLACIITPKQRLKVPAGAEWCADNGVYGKGYPGDAAWWEWVDGLPWPAETCAFVVAPDVVGDAAATLTRSLPWLPLIRARGFPAAFVAQDGLEELEVPWDAFDVLFIGGTDAFKLGPHAAELAREAKLREKRVHLGRVNSLKRMRYAAWLDCDSADGTYLVFGPDVNLPKVLGWVREVTEQAVLPW